ncbi:MAG: leucine-rich repeat domain-containing protein [Muribaculum sp.]|nr:leucine-rich repeat domain-containing protein [Muribaculum sp.]
MKRIITKLGMVIAVLLSFLPASAYDFEVDGIYYDVISFTDFTCEVVNGDVKYEGDVIIPSKVTYNNRELTVTKIARPAFEDCGSLTSVTIPDSMTEIGQYAFNGCRSLTSVAIPDSVTEIEGYAFSGCSSISTITIPDSVTEIGQGAFEGCISLNSIKLSDNLNSIENALFNGCESLSSLSIPKSVGSLSCCHKEGILVSDFTFENCINLKSIRIEYGETTLRILNSDFGRIFWWMDYSDAPVETFFIDRKLYEGRYYYNLCDLKDYVIGEHIAENQVSIEEAEDLESITCYATVPPTNISATNAQYMNVVVKVPNESLEAYQQVEGWKNYWNLQGFDPTTGVEEVGAAAAERVEVGRYNLNGQNVGEDYDGIVIVRYSDGSTRKMIQE